jgi:flavin-dependent dehydrogenase
MHLGPLGQIGLCPLGDGEVNLNLLLAPPSAVLLRLMGRERLFRAALAATPTLATRCHGAMLSQVMASGSLPQRSSSVIGDGLCLVGDAAGFCDPFTGEGMTIAARGAGLLADVIQTLDVDRMPRERDLACYARTFRAVIGRRRSVGEALQGVLARRRAAESVAALIGRLPLLARLLVADASGYRRGIAQVSG